MARRAATRQPKASSTRTRESRRRMRDVASLCEPSSPAPGHDAEGHGEGDTPVPVSDAELGAFDDLGPGGTWVVQGRAVRVTNLDKVLFPGRGKAAITKREFIRYYARVAHLMLPYLEGRP